MAEKDYLECEKLPIIRELDYYLSVETKHFYFDVYKVWNSCSDKKQVMFRASANLIINSRKYHIDHALFAEWDYENKQTAFEEAKNWIFTYMKKLHKELSTCFESDVQEVRHGKNITTEHPVDEFICSECGIIFKDVSEYVPVEEIYREFYFKYCLNCGAKMDKE